MTAKVHAAVFRSGDHYIAQCLELDIAAQGRTEREALDRVRLAFLAEIGAARERNGSVFEIGPPPTAVLNHMNSMASSQLSRVA